LEVGGAHDGWMRDTLSSIQTLKRCTVEYQPCMVHAGPFAYLQSAILHHCRPHRFENV
jgi:formyltetrahydrofolate synthetase